MLAERTLVIRLGKNPMHVPRFQNRSERQHRCCSDEPQAQLSGRLADKREHAVQSKEIWWWSQALYYNNCKKIAFHGS